MNKLVAIFLLLILASCGQYPKALKTDDAAIKYKVGEEMYEKGEYSKAIRLFEQIAPAYRGKPQSEKLFYMFAQSYYKNKQYYLSGYQFESFVSMYPKSEKVEESAYLGAFSYSKLSPVYSLDQIDTYKALDKLQNFIDIYPNSTYLPEANQTIKTLREKLEKKAFEIAKQYNTIRDYKAAQIAFNNFILDYPGTVYKEDALYYSLDSAYKLAINSIPSKMKERLLLAKESYTRFNKTFGNSSKYKQLADEMAATIDRDLQQFSK
jgi:outer membrane protein assembly factor BamD